LDIDDATCTELEIPINLPPRPSTWEHDASPARDVAPLVDAAAPQQDDAPSLGGAVVPRDDDAVPRDDADVAPRHIKPSAKPDAAEDGPIPNSYRDIFKQAVSTRYEFSSDEEVDACASEPKRRPTPSTMCASVPVVGSPPKPDARVLPDVTFLGTLDTMSFGRLLSHNKNALWTHHLSRVQSDV
jgi:hypothetical protein